VRFAPGEPGCAFSGTQGDTVNILNVVVGKISAFSHWSDFLNNWFHASL
jgi:hypothetical protein